MATTGPALHGLSRDVTLAVLPRLYMEELVTELNRRNVVFEGGSFQKDILICVLQAEMTKEYNNLESHSGVCSPDNDEDNENFQFSPDAELAEQLQCQVLQENSQTLSRVCPSSDIGNRQLTQATTDAIAEDRNVEFTRNAELSVEATHQCYNEEDTTGTNQESYSKHNDLSSATDPDKNASFNSLISVLVSAIEENDIITKESWSEGTSTITSASIQPTSQLDTVCPPKTKRDEDKTKNNGVLELLPIKIHGFQKKKSKYCMSDPDPPETNSKTSSRKNKKKSTQGTNSKTSSRKNKKKSSNTKSKPSKAKFATPFFACKDCDYRTTQMRYLVRHTLTHTGEKPYMCPSCDFTSNRSTNIKTHILARHLKKKPYQCSACSYQTVQKSLLVKHIRKHTGEKGEHTCSVCGLDTLCKASLDKHMMQHTGEKPYMCDECDFRTAYKACLQSHKLTHTGLKPYLCDECGFGTNRKDALAAHQRLHTGEKPFTCEDCGYKAASSSVLWTHRKKHTGKWFLCGDCDYKSLYRHILRRHMKRHTDGKPLSCDQCGFMTTSNSRLVTHRDIHFVDEPITHVCDQCGFMTTSDGKLVAHKQVCSFC